MADSAIDEKCVKLANKSDFSAIDAEFILQYANEDTEVLDVASGTGLIVNKIAEKVRCIDCIEPFQAFSHFISRRENIRIFNVMAIDFVPDKKYDLITFFACMHYFSDEEAGKIYARFRPMLTDGGIVIIKNQFGVREDVTVCGYSEEQKTDYFAQYRTVQRETALLTAAGFSGVKSYDVYPASCNRWQNTHFYALVATA